MNIHTTTIRGELRFVLGWSEGGKRRRRYFLTRREAEVVGAAQAREKAQHGSEFLTIEPAIRAELVSLWSEAERRGVSLRAALTYFLDRPQAQAAIVPLSAALTMFLAEKRTGGRATGAYRSTIGRFIEVAGRGRAIGTVTRDDVLSWVNLFEQPSTRNSYLTSIKSFFRWAHERAEIIASDPAAKVDKIGKRQIPKVAPCILTAEMVQRLLDAATRLAPDLVPVLALGLFAGARPDEALKLRWEDIGESVYFSPTITKTRDVRHSDISPALTAWLAPHRRAGGSLAPTNYRRKLEDVRVAAGLSRRDRIEGKTIKRQRGYALVNDQRAVSGAVLGWGHDCLRHSFGSHYFALNDAAKTIAQMGHAERDYATFFNHYRACVTKKDAAAFWAVRPK